MPDLLVVVDYVAEVVAAAVVRFSHAHRVVGEVDIAVVAEELRHGDGGMLLEVVGEERRRYELVWICSGESECHLLSRASEVLAQSLY